VDAVLRLGYDAAGHLARALAALAPAGEAKLLRAPRHSRSLCSLVRRAP
jgi:hypothetical protein